MLKNSKWMQIALGLSLSLFLALPGLILTFAMAYTLDKEGLKDNPDYDITTPYSWNNNSYLTMIKSAMFGFILLLLVTIGVFVLTFMALAGMPAWLGLD